MDNETRVSRDTVRQALQNYYDSNGQSVDNLMDQMSHMIYDYHDFQMGARKVSRGKKWLFSFKNSLTDGIFQKVWNSSHLLVVAVEIFAVLKWRNDKVFLPNLSWQSRSRHFSPRNADSSHCFPV